MLKDNVVTLDKMESTAGSLALVGARPNHEASVITKLRKAGVVLLGKTNLSEWSNFRSEKSSSGWSPRGGQTYGAYLKNSQPSGSSSGSAVAVALGLAWAALGTEVSFSTSAKVLRILWLTTRDNWQYHWTSRDEQCRRLQANKRIDCHRFCYTSLYQTRCHWHIDENSQRCCSSAQRIRWTKRVR